MKLIYILLFIFIFCFIFSFFISGEDLDVSFTKTFQSILNPNSSSLTTIMGQSGISQYKTSGKFYYKLLPRTGNESLYSISFRDISVFSYSYLITHDENGTLLPKPLNVSVNRTDTIICPEMGWDSQQVITYKDENKTIVDKNYTYTVPETLPFYINGIKQPDLVKTKANQSSATSSSNPNKFCYQANKEKDFHIKIGDKSIITILEAEVVSTSLLTNVTAETGDANFTHLNISGIAPFNESLVGYWSFDGDNVNSPLNTSYDFSQYNNDGTMVADALVNSTECLSEFGDCLRLDGTGDYISFPYSDSLNITGDQFTIIGWIYSRDVTQGGMLAGIPENPGDFSNHYGLRVHSNKELRLYAQTTDALVFFTTSSDPIALPNVWYHIAGVYNTTNLLLYIDGSPVSDTPPAQTGNLLSNGMDLVISGSAGSALDFNGSYDEIMVFNVSLTPAQILDIYNNQSARFVDTGTQRIRAVNITNTTTWDDGGFDRVNLTTTFNNNFSSKVSGRIGQFNSSVNVSNLVLYMPFEWGSAVDISGEGNDGTLINQTFFNSTGGLNDTGGFELDGNGDYVVVSDDDSLSFGNGTEDNNFSVSMWINVKGIDQGASLISKLDEWRFNPTGNHMEVIFIDDSSNGEIGITTNGGYGDFLGDIGSWIHLAFTYNGTGDSTGMDMYRNGVVISTPDNSFGSYTAMENTGNDVYIGRVGGKYVNGSMDEVMIFNRTLSATEISQMYNDTVLKYNIAYYTPYQNLTSGANSTFTIDTEADFIFPDLLLIAGNDSITPFYTPIIYDDIILDTYTEAAPPVGDVTKPNVTINTPTNITYNVNSIVFNVTALDETSMTNGGCWVSIDAGVTNLTLTNTTHNDQYNATNTTVPDNGYQILAWCNDTQNNINNSETQDFLVDTVFPEITITYPSNLSNSSDTTLDVNYTYTELNCDSVWFTNDSLAANTSLGCGTNITTITWAEGQHNVTVWINDTGNQINSSFVRFTIDTVAPDISIATPTNLSNSSDTGLNINYTTSETLTSVDTCWFSNDTYSTNTTLGSCANITTVTWSEGNHNVTVWANDSADNVNSSIVFFTIDTTYPEMSITNPTNLSNLSSTTFDLNYTFVETNGDKCWYSNNSGGTNSSYVSIGTNWTDLTGEEGDNNRTVYCNDSVNQVNSTIVFFTIDTIYPEISITHPINLTNYSSATQDLNYTFAETNPDFCWYSNDSGAINSTTITMGTNWTDLNAAEGNDNWTVYCNDSANNINSSIVYFTIDTINPEITITNPTNLSNLSSATFDLNYTFIETNDGFCWYSNNSGVGNSSVVTIGTNWTDLTGTEGYNNRTIYCNDSANNQNSSIVYFTIDTVAPDINITYPSNNTDYTDTGLNINYTRSDATTSVDTCWYSNDSMAANTTLTSCTNITGVTWTLGVHNVTIWVNDSSNNVNYSYVNFTIDTIAPNVNITYPVNNTDYTDTGLNINYTRGSNVNTCWYSNDTYAANTTLTSCINITTVTWTIGIHNVTVWVNDSLNNINSSYVNFSISVADTTNPEITITNPTNLSNLSSATFDLNYTFVETNPGFCWYSNDSGAINSSAITMGTNWTDLTGAEGYINRTIYCNDTTNNQNSSIVYFTIDTTYPQISISTPTNLSNSSDTTLNINYTATDTNIESCWYSNDSMSANTTLTDCTTNITTVTWIEGQHNVTIWANDSSNNINSSFVRFTIDITPPYFTDFDNQTLRENQALSYDINATDLYTEVDCFTTNWTTNFTIDCDGILTNSTVLAVGYHKINITVNDSLNNLNSSLFSVNVTAINSTGYILFSNETDYTDYKTLFQEGEEFFIWINWTDELNSPINTSFGECNISLIDGVQEVSSINDNFTICGAGCDYLEYTETFDMETTVDAVMDTGHALVCNEQLQQQDAEVNISCNGGAISYFETRSGAGIPLCSVGTSFVEVNTSVCLGFTDINVSVTYDGIFQRRKRVLDLAMDREYSIHEGEVIFNETAQLWQTNHTHEYYKHGTKTITTNCSHYTYSNYDNSTIETITIVNRPPQILDSQMTNNLGTFVVNGTLSSPNIYEYVGGLWNWSFSIVDDDIDTHNITWYNSSGTSLESIQMTGFIGDHNTTTELFANFSSENIYNLTIWANDTNENRSIRSFYFNVTDTTLPEINITYPINHTNTTDTGLNINYTTLDDLLDACWYSNDSMASNTTLSTCANITTITWTEGQHNVTVWANDTSNNINSSFVTFTIDLSPPDFINLANQTLDNETALLFDIDATDLYTEVDCFTVNDTNFSITCAGVLTNATNFPANIYWINITVNDSLNNLNSSIMFVNYTFAADTTPPYFVTLSNYTNTVNTTFTETIVADDETAFGSYTLNDTSIFIINRTNGTITNNTALVNVTIYYLNITINDTSNNLNSSIFWINITNVTFSMNISSPINTTYGTSSISINLSTTGTPDIYWYSLDGASNITFTPNETITGVGWEAWHDLIIYANDTGGTELRETRRFFIGTEENFWVWFDLFIIFFILLILGTYWKDFFFLFISGCLSLLMGIWVFNDGITVYGVTGFWVYPFAWILVGLGIILTVGSAYEFLEEMEGGDF